MRAASAPARSLAEHERMAESARARKIKKDNMLKNADLVAKSLESSHDFDFSFSTVLVYLTAVMVYKRKHNKKTLAVVVSAVVVLKRGVARWKQRRLAEVKDRYFLYPFSTALALMRLRVQEALAQKDKGRS